MPKYLTSFYKNICCCSACHVTSSVMRHITSHTLAETTVDECSFAALLFVFPCVRLMHNECASTRKRRCHLIHILTVIKPSHIELDTHPLSHVPVKSNYTYVKVIDSARHFTV